MATRVKDRKSSLSQQHVSSSGRGRGSNQGKLTKWAREYHEELKVAGVAALVAFFFTHGLPLWDDDYSQWLRQANGNFLDLLGRIIFPFTTEAQSWGYADRPLQVFLYKILHLIFGDWGTGYFFVKSAAFGGFIGLIYHFLRHRVALDRWAACVAVALFGLSANVMSSVIWLSDFGVISQALLIFTLFYAYDQIEKGPSSTAVYKKGLDALPKAFTRFLLIFFALVYFGSKIRADLRLAPVVMLAFLYFFRREKFKVYAAPFAITFLFTLPWSMSLFTKLPPFVPGSSGYTGWTYSQFSVFRVFEFLTGDILTFTAPGISVFSGLGIFFFIAALAYAGFRLYKDDLPVPGERHSFYLVWLGVALLACGMLARQTGPFQLRYTLIPLVPAVFLLGFILKAALGEFHKIKWVKPAVIALAVIQCGLHVYHDFLHRRDMGRTRIAVDKIYRTLEDPKYASTPGGTSLYMPGFLPYGFRDSASPVLQGRRTLENYEDITKHPVGTTFVMSWFPTLDVRFSLVEPALGCGSNLFDAIVGCGATDGAMLLRYVGSPPELAQSSQLEQQGNLAGGREVLDGYLKKDPGNHGVAFILSLYNYRLQDYPRMEALYDIFGRYHMGHGSVVYNWGLAKQGVQKYAEASKLLEIAHNRWPDDYGIGFNLADSYYRAGKKRRAIATLDDLMKKYPNDANMKNVYNQWSK